MPAATDGPYGVADTIPNGSKSIGAHPVADYCIIIDRSTEPLHRRANLLSHISDREYISYEIDTISTKQLQEFCGSEIRPDTQLYISIS